MKIGLDFDNTMVCYDRAFHVAAMERDWLPEGIAHSKQAVKSYLRGEGRNDDWTELQGYVYGPGMKNAEPFPGLLDFLSQATRNGWELCVVSHRTRHPYLGPQYDLHEAAREWIENSELLRESTGLKRQSLFFEEVKEDKVARIGAVGANVFFDDLPEILQHEQFPAEVRKFLFDPNNSHPETSLQKVSGWSEAVEAVSEVCLS